MLRGKGFHGLEDPQVLIPPLESACSKTTLVTLVSTIIYCSFVSCTATIIRLQLVNDHEYSVVKDRKTVPLNSKAQGRFEFRILEPALSAICERNGLCCALALVASSSPFLPI